MSMKANKNLQPVLNWILKTDNCSAKNNDINIPSVDPYKLWYAIAIIIISKFLESHSIAKPRAPAYSCVLHDLKHANNVADLGMCENSSGRINFRSVNSSLTLFCNGVPVSKKRCVILYLVNALAQN